MSANYKALSNLVLLPLANTVSLTSQLPRPHGMLPPVKIVLRKAVHSILCDKNDLRSSILEVG